MRANGAGTATCALDLCITWKDGTVLRQEHLCPPRSYTLREHGTGDDEAEFVVSGDWLAGPEHELISVDERGVVAHAPSGAIRLERGERTMLQIGPLTFHVRLSEPLPAAAGIRSSPVQPKQHVWTAASLAVHLLALACMGLMPPKASSLSLDALDEDTRYARYLTQPVEQEALPWNLDQAPAGAAEDSGEAARHAGDEGQAGAQDAPKTDRRMGIVGRDRQRVPAKLSAATAGQQGILGVLASMPQGLQSSSFGGEQAMGYDPVAAMGALFGARLGENQGIGGLGLRGTGRSGGGDATGTIGVGRLNTGEGTRGAPGHGVMTGVRREAHVPQLRMGEAAVSGSLSKEAIRRVIHFNLAQVRHCYEQALATRPDLAGRVSIRFMISPSGVVQQSAVAQSTLGNATLDTCVADAVRRWTFPAPDGGGYVHVTYPFLFERAGE